MVRIKKPIRNNASLAISGLLQEQVFGTVRGRRLWECCGVDIVRQGWAAVQIQVVEKNADQMRCHDYRPMVIPAVLSSFADELANNSKLEQAASSKSEIFTASSL